MRPRIIEFKDFQKFCKPPILIWQNHNIDTTGVESYSIVNAGFFCAVAVVSRCLHSPAYSYTCVTGTRVDASVYAWLSMRILYLLPTIVLANVLKMKTVKFQFYSCTNINHQWRAHASSCSISNSMAMQALCWRGQLGRGARSSVSGIHSLPHYAPLIHLPGPVPTSSPLTFLRPSLSVFLSYPILNFLSSHLTTRAVATASPPNSKIINIL